MIIKEMRFITIIFCFITLFTLSEISLLNAKTTSSNSTEEKIDIEKKDVEKVDEIDKKSDSVITIEQYVEAVKNKYEGYQGSQNQQIGYDKLDKVYDLYFSPRFFIEAGSEVNERKPNTPAIQGNSTEIQSLQSGFEAITQFGSEAKIYYSQSKTDIKGANPNFLVDPSFYNNSFNFELTQHLWQDGFGKQTRARQKARIETFKASSFQNIFNQKQIIYDSELKYWKLASINDKLKVRRKAINIANNTYKIIKTKVDRNLADKADLLQILAYLKTVKYEIEMLEYNLELAKNEFYQKLQYDEAYATKTPSLPINIEKYINSLDLGKLDFERDDIKSLGHNVKSNRLNNEAEIYANKPTLDFIIRGSTTGRNTHYGSTMNEIYNISYPYYYTGVKFSVPLNINGLVDVNKGYSSTNSGLKMEYVQSVKNSKLTLDNLKKNFIQQLNLFKSLNNLVQIEQQRTEEERHRYKLGKITAFQLNQIETNFLKTQTDLIELKEKILNLFSELKTFEITK